jgi:hypothetical protein
MALISKGNEWVAGFCTALAIQIRNTHCSTCKSTVVAAANSAGITINMAKEVGVDNFDIETLRTAGVG